MEQLPKEIASQTEEENATTVEEAAMDAENTEVPSTIQTEAQEQPNTETAKEQQVKQPNINLLYEECLGFIPGIRNGKQDCRYVYAKFGKDYKDFH